MSRMKQSLAPIEQCDEIDRAPRRPSSLHGFYMLADDGGLARLDVHGRPALEPDMNAALQEQIAALLRSYRHSPPDQYNLALVAGSNTQSDSNAATLIFSDWALNELFDAGRLPGMPLTLYEQRNKFKSVLQGMEILLNKKRTPAARFPYYCPVLVEPRTELDVLCERYNVELLEDAPLFEILDLSAPQCTTGSANDALMGMVRQMRSAQLHVPADAPSQSDAQDGVETRAQSVSLPAAMVALGARSMCSAPLAPAPETCFNSGDPVNGWLLEWFTPFNELTDTQRDIIAGYETIRKASAGTTLIERGSSCDSCIYLVEGTLALTGMDGSAMRVSGGTRRSRLPISLLSPHAFDVTAVTDVSVIQFNRQLIEKINEITRTYNSVERGAEPAHSTADISNGAQTVYLRHDTWQSPEDGP